MSLSEEKHVIAMRLHTIMCIHASAFMFLGSICKLFLPHRKLGILSSRSVWFLAFRFGKSKERGESVPIFLNIKGVFFSL